MRLKVRVAALYESKSGDANIFRYTLLLIDIATIIFLVISTFMMDEPWVIWVDVAIGIYVLLDYLARLWIAGRKLEFIRQPLNLVDLLVILSLFAPLFNASLSFLRSLRTLRLLRSYRLQNKLREDFDFYRRNEDVINSALNLLVFLFVMTELVFMSQHRINPEIGNFLDALYFTVTTLTTTGFGDVTLVGDGGRLLAIFIMVIGVSLFLRLIQTIFRPSKVRYTCEDCGLFLHDRDAVCCKHCGSVLHIPNEGDV
ncbi:potassium channel family protein [Rhizobium alvei]|uniref:Potassium channel family protein n=1 Tax=Rhizobium alvei TaxID=1132659 RepID=A0ABT8YL88_9HYPH|nr:potassium channel family protein [Rhizobium alvei]MDO6964412.1 potassium channel family protein [Rhizobium alvei]